MIADGALSKKSGIQIEGCESNGPAKRCCVRGEKGNEIREALKVGIVSYQKGIVNEIATVYTVGVKG